METHVILNGELRSVPNAQLPILSEGALYGYGCFETMYWSVEGGIRFELLHRERLMRVTKVLGLELDCEHLPLSDWANELAKHHGLRIATARLSLHKEGPKVHVLFRLFSGSEEKSKEIALGKSPIPHPGLSPLSACKHNNYLLNLLALQRAREDGYDEALLCREDEVIEGTLSNVFLFKDERLLTPPLSRGPLSGVVREKMIRMQDQLPVPLVEEKIYLSDIAKAQALLLTNATRLVMRVCRFEDHTFSEKISEDIQSRLETAVSFA